MITSALLLGAASFMMLSGFDSAATVDDVLAKYQEASTNATEFSADMDLGVDVSLFVKDYDMSLGVKGNGDLSMACTTDPLAIGMDGAVTVDVMGESMNINLQQYMIPEEDGSLASYTYTETPGEEEGEVNGEWSKTSIPAEVVEKLMDMIKNGGVDYSELPITFTLGDAPVDVNGAECYQLYTTLTFQDVLALIEYAVSKAGEEAAGQLPPTEELAAFEAYVGGIKVNLEIDVDTTTYLPACFHMDTEGTDWASIAALAASAMGLADEEGNPMEVELNVDSLYANAVYDYETPVSIVVPQEAIDSAQEIDPAEALGALEGAVDGE